MLLARIPTTQMPRVKPAPFRHPSASTSAPPPLPPPHLFLCVRLFSVGPSSGEAPGLRTIAALAGLGRSWREQAERCAERRLHSPRQGTVGRLTKYGRVRFEARPELGPPCAMVGERLDAMNYTGNYGFRKHKHDDGETYRDRSGSGTRQSAHDDIHPRCSTVYTKLRYGTTATGRLLSGTSLPAC